MFDMAKWDTYLTEYRINARDAGATTCDIMELLILALNREIVKAKGEYD